MNKQTGLALPLRLIVRQSSRSRFSLSQIERSVLSVKEWKGGSDQLGNFEAN